MLFGVIDVIVRLKAIHIFNSLIFSLIDINRFKMNH